MWISPEPQIPLLLIAAGLGTVILVLCIRIVETLCTGTDEPRPMRTGFRMLSIRVTGMHQIIYSTATKVLEETVAAHPLVLDDPETLIKVHELADSSVNFICRPWTLTADYWTVYWDLTRQVKENFDAAGVSIPFPQRDVHLFKES